MRTKLFAINALTAAISQIVIMISGFVFQKIYLSVYGSEINGLVYSITQFVSYFNLIEAGMASAMIYALYKPLAIKDYKIINSILSTGKHYYVKLAKYFTYLVILLALIYPLIIHEETVDNWTIILLVLVIGFSGSLEFFTMAKYRILLVADQRVYILSLASTISSLIGFSIMIFLALNEVNIVYVRAAYLIVFIVRSSLLKYYVSKNYEKINYKGAINKAFINRQWDAFIQTLTNSLNLSVPVVIITIFCTLNDVSVFSIYNMVISGLIGIVSIFSTGVSAGFGNVLANGEKSVLKQAYEQYEVSIYIIITVFFSTASVLIVPFVNLFTMGVKDVNYASQLLGILFSVWGIINTIRIPQDSIITASGQFREVRNLNLIQIIILVITNIILSLFLGLVGVLIGVIVASIYRFVFFVIVSKRITNHSYLITIRRVFCIFIILIFANLPFINMFKISIYNYSDFIYYGFVVFLWSTLLTGIINLLFDYHQVKNIILRFMKLLHLKNHNN